MPASVTPASRRGDRPAVHTFAVPVVRELPSQPADAANYLTW